jgi:hypothetical protein
LDSYGWIEYFKGFDDIEFIDDDERNYQLIYSPTHLLIHSQSSVKDLYYIGMIM